MEKGMTSRNGASIKHYGKTFGLCFLFAALLMFPLVVNDAYKGEFFHYIGDFNLQYIPFNLYGNGFVKHGGTYSWATDIGSGMLTAYSYYLFGSPFFWLSMLLPAAWMPYAMAPLVALKLAVAGGGAYLWARRWVKHGEWAVLAGVLYALSGFSIYNIVFYNFLDAIALFPYLLAALDAAVWDDTHGPFLLLVAMNLLNNYFFFFGQVVFLILYFACMVRFGQVKLTGRLFGKLALESVAGVLLAGVLFVPSVVYLLGNERATNLLSGMELLFYPGTEHYLQIFNSALLMPDVPFSTALYPDYMMRWRSLSAYLPAIGIAGGLALWKSERKHPLARVLAVSVVFAMVPVLNSLFAGLNNEYYARWFYMPVLVLAGASALALDRTDLREQAMPGAVKTMLLCTLATIVLALLPTRRDDVWQIGTVAEQWRFWLIFGISMAGALAFAAVLRRSRPEKLAENVLAVVLVVGFVAGTVHCILGKSEQDPYNAHFTAETYGSVAELNAALPQSRDYRIDVYDGYDNMGLWLDKSSIVAFNSTSDSSIVRFYNALGIERTVNSQPSNQYYALRGLLGVRYNLVPLRNEEAWLEECNYAPEEGENTVNFYNGNAALAYNKVAVEGWHKVGQTSEYAIYENENAMPMGYAMDAYVLPGQIEQLMFNIRGNALLKGVLLEDEQQAARFADLLAPLPDEALEYMDYDGYAANCATLRKRGVTDFEMNNYGFTAATDYENTEFVVFSVPYSEGFTATVNGQPVEVEQVNGGLMGIVVPGGHCDIVFDYQTPGWTLGLAVSGVGAVVTLVYLAVVFYRKRKNKAV